MNIETVRSLTKALKSAGEWVRTKGENRQALADLKYHIGQACDTEQDLRNPEFLHEVRQLERLHLTGNESKVLPPKPSAATTPTPAATSVKATAATISSAPSSREHTSKSDDPADSGKNADLTAKKSGLA